MERDIAQKARLKALDKNVRKTLRKSKNCAQTSFSVLQREFDLEGDGILKALTPFPGIALRGEACGALIGGLMAIGSVYGRNDLDDWKGYLATLPPSRRFCRRFEEQNGSTACADLLEGKLGKRYDLANRAEALKYAVAGGEKACAEIISTAVHIAVEIIENKLESPKPGR
jgi:C_GCAxxG_C_C family probable redox protein